MLSVILYLICPCFTEFGRSAVVPTGIWIDDEVSIIKFEPSNVKNELSINSPLVSTNTIRDFVKSFILNVDNIVSPLTYYAYVAENSVLGYSSFSDMGDFYFVGNTYIQPENRGQGIYTKLLSNRNAHLSDKPKITLVNPIEGTDIAVLFRQVNKQGGIKVESYEDVEDIMCLDMYNKLNTLPLFVYRWLLWLGLI